MTATYRLQLTPTFGFDAACDVVPYLQRLGVSHLYLSPIFSAPPESTHGYDVIDHNTIRAEYGGREGFERLRAAAVEAGLGLVLDFVPNHAGVGSGNIYWQDVLAYGQASPYAPFFDIEWMPLKEALHGKVLLPFLGAPYGKALDAGEISVDYDQGRFYATYYDNRFALNPASYPLILEPLLDRLERQEPYFDLKDLLDAYADLQPDERQKAETLRRRLLALDDRLAFADLKPLPTDDLHALLERQPWRLAFWKTAGYEINYRRFFDINGLVALRMEDDDVFWDAHQLLGELLSEEGVTGVRIDHVDGLYDPQDYLERLGQLGAKHVWVEKILAPGEALPASWPVDGTTGYEFMNGAMGVLTQPLGQEPLTRIYRRFVPDAEPYDVVVHDSKVLVMETALSSELFRLAYGLNRLSEADYHTRDFTLGSLREALAEVVAAFGRYRTYLPHGEDEARVVLAAAIQHAQQRNPAVDPSVFHFIADLALGDVRDDLQAAQRAWTARFQQYTAPVAAKGVEDTAFYRYVRLIALNEVGGEPDHFALAIEAFHKENAARAASHPETMLTVATHDHKRGADTRMRLIALAELPGLWQQTLRRLDRLARPHRQPEGPDRTAEFIFYQTLAALWHDADRDALPDRLWRYMQKAARESKTHTSWINPDERYEAALETFVRGLLADDGLPDVLDELGAALARYGFANTLSQTVLLLTTPGVPDLYQGTELLDCTLVDPDNRDPVDYAARARLLDELGDLLASPDPDAIQAWVNAGDPRAKFYAVAQLLRLRSEQAALFAQGSYEPLAADSTAGERALAFARRQGDSALVVIATRFPASEHLGEATTFSLPEDLAERTWTDVLTGHVLRPSATLSTADLPLAWAVLVAG